MRRLWLLATLLLVPAAHAEVVGSGQTQSQLPKAEYVEWQRLAIEAYILILQSRKSQALERAEAAYALGLETRFKNRAYDGQHLADIFRILKRPARTQAILEILLADATSTSEDDESTRQRVPQLLADSLMEQALYREARPYYVQYLQSALAEHHREFVVAGIYEKIGDIDAKLGDIASAEKHYLLALEFKPASSYAGDNVSRHIKLGGVYAAWKRPVGAEREYLAAVNMAEKMYDPYLSLPWALKALGAYYQSIGQTEKAKAVQGRRDPPLDHPSSW